MTDRGAGQPPSREGDGARRAISYPKAVLLLAGAAALAVYLIQLGPASVGGARPAAGTTTSPPTTSSSASTTTTTTTTTTTPTSTSTTQAQGAPTTSVKVLVANASQTNGVATYYSKQLATDGWGTVTPVTALTAEATSSVYYAPGDQAYAGTVATELGVGSSPQAVGVTMPVTRAITAQVVVVIGDDLAAKAHTGG